MSHTDKTTEAISNGSVTPVTNLVPHIADESPVQLLQETLNYATSPKNYLIRELGKDIVEQRLELLSIPAEPVDRDLYGRGVHKQHFEQHIAKLFGKEHGLYFITGVQAQLASMKIWCDKASNNRVSWHYLSHPETAESNAWAEVFHFQRTFVGKSQGQVPTVDDIKAITSLPVEARPAAMLLELPNRELGCKTYPYDDLVQISQLCKAANIKLHMDGARIWEIQPFYHGKSFADIARFFDSVYVSFYKGLSGTVGSMLISSDAEFMDEAKKWQCRLGGRMVTSYPTIIDCERGYNLNIGTFDLKWQKMCSVASAIMEATKEYRTKDGRPIVYFDPEVPTCSQAHTHIQGMTSEQLAAAGAEVEKKYHISVFRWTKPWQISDETNAEWVSVKRETIPVEGNLASHKEDHLKDHHYTEWSIRDSSMLIEDKIFAEGWKALCQVIVASQ